MIARLLARLRAHRPRPDDVILDLRDKTPTEVAHALIQFAGSRRGGRVESRLVSPNEIELIPVVPAPLAGTIVSREGKRHRFDGRTPGLLRLTYAMRDAKGEEA